VAGAADLLSPAATLPATGAPFEVPTTALILMAIAMLLVGLGARRATR
jgi:hypothetical protein